MTDKGLELVSHLDTDKVDLLGAKFKQEFDDAEKAKSQREDMWLRVFRMFKGQYDPTILDNIKPGKSKAYANLARPRVMFAVSRIMEILAPVGGRPLTVSRTPFPHMPDLVAKLAASGMEDPEDIEKAVFKEAEERAAALERKLNDDMTEGEWERELWTATYNGVLYGNFIMCGPMAVNSNATNQQAFRGLGPENDDVRPVSRAVSVWDFYGAPGYSDTRKMPYAFERSIIDKSVLMDFANDDEHYLTDTVKEILKTSPNGDWVPRPWECEIFNITKQNEQATYTGKYELLIRWGFISGEDMAKAGIDVPEEKLNHQFMSQAWIVCGRVIAIRVSKIHRDAIPYYSSGYSEVCESFWKTGMVECIMDSVLAFNACERAIYDNMAFCAGGPIREIIQERLVDPKDALTLVPGDTVRTKERESPGGAQRAVYLDWATPHTTEFRQKQADILMMIQDQSGIPNALLGQGGYGVHDRTASGASMQYNNAITPLKGIIMNFEQAVVEPLLNKYYEFYKTFSKDDSVIGDHKVVTKGVSGMIAREVFSQKMEVLSARAAQFPEWAKKIDMSRIIEAELRNAGIWGDKFTFTDSEVRANEEAARMAEEQSMARQEMIRTTAEKTRAESSPVDTMIAALNAVPDSAEDLKLILVRDLLSAKGILSQQAEAAIAEEMVRNDFKVRAEAVNAGLDAYSKAADIKSKSSEVKNV